MGFYHVSLIIFSISIYALTYIFHFEIWLILLLKTLSSTLTRGPKHHEFLDRAPNVLAELPTLPVVCDGFSCWVDENFTPNRIAEWAVGLFVVLTHWSLFEKYERLIWDFAEWWEVPNHTLQGPGGPIKGEISSHWWLARMSSEKTSSLLISVEHTQTPWEETVDLP